MRHPYDVKRCYINCSCFLLPDEQPAVRSKIVLDPFGTKRCLCTPFNAALIMLLTKRLVARSVSCICKSHQGIRQEHGVTLHVRAALSLGHILLPQSRLRHGRRRAHDLTIEDRLQCPGKELQMGQLRDARIGQCTHGNRQEQNRTQWYGRQIRMRRGKCTLVKLLCQVCHWILLKRSWMSPCRCLRTQYRTSLRDRRSHLPHLYDIPRTQSA